LSWTHNKTSKLATIVTGPQSSEPGFVIEFTGVVQFQSVDDPDHVFQVLVESGAGGRSEGLRCRCATPGRVVPVKPIQVNSNQEIVVAEVQSPDSNAVAFLPDLSVPAVKRILEIGGEFWIVLRCDFVVDVNNRAVDGEFVRAELPTGDRPSGSPFGTQGGLFESWFRVERG
jgi:hypothetical protein